MYYCKDLNCAGMIFDAKAAIIEALTDGERWLLLRFA